MNPSYPQFAARLFIFAFLALVAALPVKAQSITADDFRFSRFRGFHMEGVDRGPRSSFDLDALARTGANMVRISVFLKRCPTCASYDLPAEDLVTLDGFIQALAVRSIYSFIALRPAGDERGPLWSSPSLQQSFIDHWKVLAARYRTVPSVAGFDLLNEPVPPGRTYADRQSTWLAFAETLGMEIRAIDSHRVLIVESAPDATSSSFGNMRVLPLPNVVYSFHSYFPLAFTHQGVMKAYPGAMTYGTTPDMNVSREALYNQLAIVDAFAAKYNVPVIVGEFSCARWAPRGSAVRYVADSIDYFEAKGWSWVYHDFRAWPGWDAEIDSESPLETRRSGTAPIMGVLRAKMSAN